MAHYRLSAIRQWNNCPLMSIINWVSLDEWTVRKESIDKWKKKKRFERSSFAITKRDNPGEFMGIWNILVHRTSRAYPLLTSYIYVTFDTNTQIYIQIRRAAVEYERTIGFVGAPIHYSISHRVLSGKAAWGEGAPTMREWEINGSTDTAHIDSVQQEQQRQRSRTQAANAIPGQHLIGHSPTAESTIYLDVCIHL